jgi:hypothetical protein
MQQSGEANSSGTLENRNELELKASRMAAGRAGEQVGWADRLMQLCHRHPTAASPRCASSNAFATSAETRPRSDT